MKPKFSLVFVCVFALLFLIVGGIAGGVVRGGGIIDKFCRMELLHHSISVALEYYQLDHGSYPTSKQGLPILLRENGGRGPYLTGDLRDPWGRPVQYSVVDGKPVIGFFAKEMSSSKK